MVMTPFESFVFPRTQKPLPPHDLQAFVGGFFFILLVDGLTTIFSE
jgi:hypothetical protein